MPDFESLGRLAATEFPSIVAYAAAIRNKLRVTLVDGSYIDFWWSRRNPSRFAYHWERTQIDGTVYRHDNFAHGQWQHMASYPKHFHAGSQGVVTESDIAENPEEGLRQFLGFAAGIIG